MRLSKTAIRLADGRELLYFDEREGIDRRTPDLRELPVASLHSEIRCDPLLDEWVIVASHRQGRTHLPPADQCPLCPSRDGRLTEIPAADYDVVVFENRFPSLSHGLEPGPGGLLQDPTGDGLFGGGQDLAAAKWCVSPPAATHRSRTCHRAALPPCSRPGPTGPGSYLLCWASSRCSFGDAPEPAAGQTVPR